MYYFVLGEKAESFYDPLTRVGVDKGKVTECKTFPQSSIFNAAIRGQHIRVLSKLELEAYGKEEPTEKRVITAESLEALTKAEIIEKFDYFEEEDKAGLKGFNKADLIEECLAIAKEYE